MSHLSTKNKILMIATIIMSFIYISWRTFFTIPFGYGAIAVLSGLALLIVEIIAMLEAGINLYNMTHVVHPKQPDVDASLYPDVDVFIATYNEPVSLLYKTINGCLNMDYPDKSKVHIYLCDDGNRAEMRELAEKMNIRYITRTDRKHAKAGNLNNALLHSSSPLVATFDADMIPMHHFLTTCVPYFLTGEKIGFIQAPQSFYNPDLFQFNLYSENRIPNEQDFFYRNVQVGRNKSNSAIYGGSNTVISRQALDDIGGFYTEVITEDFATGMLIQSKGYKCYAINDVLASGLSPSDLKSLIKQRERWARGGIQTGKKLNILFRKGLSFSQKLNYISSIFYWYSSIKRFIYILSPILFAVFSVVVVKATVLQVLVFWLPMYLLMNASLRLISSNIRNTKWSNVYETIMFPSLLPVIMLETFGISQKKFAVTRKDGVQNDRAYHFKHAIPHMILAVLSVIGIIKCIMLTFETGSMSFVVVLFWLLVNFYNILMSIFFMLGRKMYRTNERMLIEADCLIKSDINEIKCTTHDLSEGGTSIVLDFPKYIPVENELTIQLFTNRYTCTVKGKIVHVTQMKDKWKYAFHFTEVEDQHLRQLLHIIYDRVPTLPQKLDQDDSTFEDIQQNLIKRNYKEWRSNRKLARMTLERDIDSIECGKVTIIDFNYEFVLLKPKDSIELTPTLTIPIVNDVLFNCVYVQQVNNNNGRLYRIENYQQYFQDERVEAILHEWMTDAFLQQQKSKKSKRYEHSDEFDEMAYL